jgi:hypothetical protein
MSKYALLIIESNDPKNLDEECKSLASILKNSNIKLQISEIHGVGALLFDLEKSLLPFCKITTSAHESGHPVRVLFLDDKNSFLLQNVGDKVYSEDVENAARAAAEYFSDLDKGDN